jgi:hypothetical protein
MATKTDTLEAKQRKQKIILAVLGVAFLGLAVLQGPKLLDQLNGSSTPAATSDTTSTTDTSTTGTSTTPTTGTTPSTGTSAGSVTTVTAPAGTPRAVLVGVDVTSGAQPVPGPGQLKTFSLFESKDPFVQSLPDPDAAKQAAGGGGGAAPAAVPGQAAPAAGAQGGGTGTGTGATGELTFATIAVNGDSESVELTKKFPKQDKMFVLVGLKQKTAKIAVAGGAFTEGQTVTLKMGDSLTLLNTATGARYTLRLLYTGTTPEQVAGFTQGAK